MLRQVLFDLDGTLIHFDHRRFVQTYIALLSKKLGEFMAPTKFGGHLLAATARMIRASDGKRTNEEIFWAYFRAHTDLDRRRIEPCIDAFYVGEFQQIRKMVTAPDISPSLEKIAAKNIPMAIATNPVFPAAAVRARLAWGNFSNISFNWITSYENSHYCKPNPLYYAEIAERVGVHPSECLMVGNDVSEDLIAGSVGMKTYLLTDAMINRGGAPIQADYIGTVEDFCRDIDQILP